MKVEKHNILIKGTSFTLWKFRRTTLIVLDEEAWAESLLKNGSPKPYAISKDVSILAKYWRYKGLETHDIRLKLEEYCYKSDPYFNDANSYWKIRNALRDSKNYRLRRAFPITITKSEVSTINRFDDYGQQRILFLLLVYAKFLKYTNTRIKPTQKTHVIGEFYVNEKMSNIVRIAKVSMTKKERKDFFNKLYDEGMFDYTFYDSLLIKYVDENSDPEIVVDDFGDITLYWARYCGERIAACSSCGKLFIKRSNRHTYCRSCWKNRERELWRLNKQKNKNIIPSLENSQNMSEN